jgi:hypothetical protein
LKIKSERDFWSGLMFVIVGVGFAWGATNYKLGSSANPGPGYFPLGLGLLLAVLGAMVLFKAMTIESAGGDPIGAVAWKPLVTILLSVLVFGLALPRLGLAVALPLLVLLASVAGDEFSLRGVIVSAVVLTVGCWAIFILGLKLVIPLWPTFFGS